MYRTKNDLSETARQGAIEILALRLAEAIDLQLQGKQAHWNVKGPSFIALHGLFDEVAEDAEKWVDLIAERIVQLGGVAEGTAQIVAERTKIPPYPLTIADGRDHIEALSTALSVFGRGARQSIDDADQLGDRDTADIFTQISRKVDKDIWFVEAHAQGSRAVAPSRAVA
jgi:starvation-inducible DNA-binding protein